MKTLKKKTKQNKNKLSLRIKGGIICPYLHGLSNSCPHRNTKLTGAKFSFLAPVVQRVDNTIDCTNYYPLDKSLGFGSIYTIDRDLSARISPSLEFIVVN